MQILEQDVLSQYEMLSRAVEEVFSVSRLSFEGNQTYYELIEVRKRLEETERNFPEPSKKLSFPLNSY